MKKLSWVQDIESNKASSFIIEWNAKIETEEIKVPKGSKYEIGPSKSKSKSKVGIYFYDPTARTE